MTTRERCDFAQAARRRAQSEADAAVADLMRLVGPAYLTEEQEAAAEECAGDGEPKEPKRKPAA